MAKVRKFTVGWNDGSNETFRSKRAVEATIVGYLGEEWSNDGVDITDNNGDEYGIIITVEVVKLEPRVS